MILVTGASGFLGRHLLQVLASRSLPVVALHHSTQPAVQLPGLRWLQCDLLDVFAVREAMAGITHVYHCAATVSFDPRDKQQMISSNVTATQHVLEAAQENGVQKLVHVSSIASLGRSKITAEGEAFIDEDTYWEDSVHNSAYAESKFQSEMEVWRAMAEGLNAVIVNPGILLGEGDWNKGSANLIRVVDREFPWFTEGINAWVDVKDVARAMVLLMESEITDERFILSAGNFPYKEIFTLMAKAVQRRPPHRKASSFMTEIVWRLELIKSRIRKQKAMISKESARTAQARCFYDNTKFLNTFPGFNYETIETTIARMAMAYKKERPT